MAIIRHRPRIRSAYTNTSTDGDYAWVPSPCRLDETLRTTTSTRPRSISRTVGDFRCSFAKVAQIAATENRHRASPRQYGSTTHQPPTTRSPTLQPRQVLTPTPVQAHTRRTPLPRRNSTGSGLMGGVSKEGGSLAPAGKGRGCGPPPTTWHPTHRLHVAAS